MKIEISFLIMSLMKVVSKVMRMSKWQDLLSKMYLMVSME